MTGKFDYLTNRPVLPNGLKCAKEVYMIILYIIYELLYYYKLYMDIKFECEF